MAHIINLEWKAFNLNLQMLDQSLRAAHPTYAGNQAHSRLELIFTEAPSEQMQAEIIAWYDALNEQSPEAAYKSKDQEAAEQQAAKDAAKAKLVALGLTEADLKALLGV